MIRDVGGLLVWLAGGAFVMSQKSAQDVSSFNLMLLGLLVFFFDAVLITPWGKTSSRVAPLVALALLFYGTQGFVVATLALLAGGLLVCLSGRNKSKIPGDMFRSLGPLGAVAVTALQVPTVYARLGLILTFLVLCMLLEPRRYALRPTLLGLFCAPWLSLAIYHLSQEAPWSMVLIIPVLIGLSSGKDDMFPLLLKMRKALLMSQEQVKSEAEKARRFHHLLQAANLMARTLKPEDLRLALEKAAMRTGVDSVKVYLPDEKWPRGEGVPLLDGKARLIYTGAGEQSVKDQLEILGRVFSTCWENAELHQKVLEALEETRRSQAQLVESSRLAAMGLMAAGVAHEVNTPLGAIQISVELAAMCLERKPEDVSKHLESVERATERARKAVERILYYAKPMGKEEAETFSVAGVVEDALALLSHRIDRARSSVRTEVPDSLHLTGERQSFYSLVFNLILNALEAVGAGDDATVWVRCGQTGERLVLEVEDSGPGVPEEVKAHIFEPFFTTRPSGEGTGLGLHLARTAAELFDGRLMLMPQREHGAIFRAEFPRPN